MKLPRRELLEGSRRRADLEPLIAAAERTLRTWEPEWSDFLPAAVREEAEARLGSLSELRLSSEGGYPGAERRRLLLRRAEAPPVLEASEGRDMAGLGGLEIAGNFLFDPAAGGDFLEALGAAGARDGEIGDLWLRGDRGAQAIVLAGLAERLDGLEGQVRSVGVRFEARPLADLHLPAVRLPRQMTTVEASLRLDAVASAGFGLSRSRMGTLIRQGAVRVQWDVVTNPSRGLAVGDRVQVEGRGELLIEAIAATRRQRFRIMLTRR